MDTITLECQDGATYETGMVRYVVRIEDDCDSSLNDYESDGRIEWSTDRPSSMDGAAMKLWPMNGGPVWWQPYGDLMGWQDDAGEWHHAKWAQLPDHVKKAERDRVEQLISFGFVGVVVERQEKCSAGHWHTDDVASLWGLEWDVAGTDYGNEVVRDLLAELGA